MKEGTVVCKGLGASLAPVEILQERGMDTPQYMKREQTKLDHVHTLRMNSTRQT